MSVTPSAEGRRPRLGLALAVIATAQLMVVLDATIVNVALPHIQRTLGFSGNGLEWVVTAYALSFGGLMLLGGRAGDLLGRRRVFIAGLVLFSAASLAGGFASSQAWLLAARVIQGIGGALIAPTSLALIATTFAEGPARNRAMSVVAAMSGGGAAVGLVAGGLLTTYLSWRWVLFVNVPIGLLTAAAARLVLPESARNRGRFDLPGAITGSGGVALLVYGLSNAGTDQSGVSHWGDTRVVASLTASALLLAVFVIIEARSPYALMPLRILANRSRSGAYLIMLALATAMFGIFFFLSIFVQNVLGYSALRSGVAFLPLAGTIVVVSGIVGQLIGRIGARAPMLAGTAITTGGMYWFSRLSEHSTYPGGLLGPMLVTGVGLGLLFVPLSLVALNRVPAPGHRPGLQPAEHRPAGRWRDRAGRARDRGLDRGRQQRPQPGDPRGGRRPVRPRPAGHAGTGIDLPPRSRRRHHPRVPDRVRNRAGRPGHHGDHHPDPARGPSRNGRTCPGPAGRRRARARAGPVVARTRGENVAPTLPVRGVPWPGPRRGR